jgi:hypothetical protein
MPTERRAVAVRIIGRCIIGWAARLDNPWRANGREPSGLPTELRGRLDPPPDVT